MLARFRGIIWANHAPPRRAFDSEDHGKLRAQCRRQATGESRTARARLDVQPPPSPMEHQGTPQLTKSVPPQSHDDALCECACLVSVAKAFQMPRDQATARFLGAQRLALA